MLRSVPRVASNQSERARHKLDTLQARHPDSWQKQQWTHVLMPLLAGFLLILANVNQIRAAELGSHEFVIPTNDGYGTSECLASQTACGRIIADAWCEAHGHAHATGYTRFEDITAAISISSKANDIPLDAIIVSCGE